MAHPKVINDIMNNSFGGVEEGKPRRQEVPEKMEGNKLETISLANYFQVWS